MITGISIDGVEARARSRKPTDEFRTNINIESVAVESGKVSLSFIWDVAYGDDFGFIKMDGVLSAQESPDAALKIKSEWDAGKKLPAKFAEGALNTINYVCTLNAPFVVKPVNLTPPINVPVLSSDSG